MYIRVLASIAWLCLSLSLGIWWTVMGLRHAQDIAILEQKISTPSEALSKLERKSKMIKYEGISFLVLIALGGFTLIAMSFRDEKRNRMIRDFFATISHEMKTPLASLRLQAESLNELIKNKNHKKLLERLISDTQRLELQMEKAMYLASITRAESLYV
ncbi:MAG: sensor histidine kinase, partial [Leptospiraceae bacterium]|nr:sensor histidine kinase [Leptospiraceae bacterium]